MQKLYAQVGQAQAVAVLDKSETMGVEGQVSKALRNSVGDTLQTVHARNLAEWRAEHASQESLKVPQNFSSLSAERRIVILASLEGDTLVEAQKQVAQVLKSSSSTRVELRTLESIPIVPDMVKNTAVEVLSGTPRIRSTDQYRLESQRFKTAAHLLQRSELTQSDFDVLRKCLQRQDTHAVGTLVRSYIEAAMMQSGAFALVDSKNLLPALTSTSGRLRDSAVRVLVNSSKQSALFLDEGLSTVAKVAEQAATAISKGSSFGYDIANDLAVAVRSKIDSGSQKYGRFCLSCLIDNPQLESTLLGVTDQVAAVRKSPDTQLVFAVRALESPFFYEGKIFAPFVSQRLIDSAIEQTSNALLRSRLEAVADKIKF